MPPIESATICLDPDTLAAYVDGLLTEGAIREADRHIDACADCRSELSALAAARTRTRTASHGGPVEPLAELMPNATLGRYVVMRELGRGGMGVVVRAFDPVLARSVAIKVLRSNLASDRAYREAQAMAQLTHPNVVTVYDVVTSDAGVLYIAMELIEGETLRGYLRGTHGWRDTLAICIRAGRGLAAAHAARLIHRDFKPENVLCSADGRVLVSDFGLARRLDIDDANPAGGGTPPYVAPELYGGGAATIASDQFSFCVATYEALYGTRPFTGANHAEIRDAILACAVPSPPATAAVPSWVRAALLRGLSRAPGERFGSMPELLDALERDPAVRRRRLLTFAVVGAAAAAIGAASVAATSSAPTPSCAIDDGALGDAWNAARRASIGRAFTLAGHPELVGKTDAAVDDYAGRWLAMRRTACQATWVRGEQSERVLDERIACLDGRRRELAEMTTLLGSADAAVATGAIAAVDRLHAPADCTAAAAGAEERRGDVADAIGTVQRAELDRAWALLDIGKHDDAAAVATAIVGTARVFGRPRVLAEALLIRGRTAQESAREVDLNAALIAAERAKDDELVAQIWIEIVGAVANQQHRERALEDGKAADAALARIDPTPQMLTRYHYTAGFALWGRNDFVAAADQFAVALKTADSAGMRGAIEEKICRALEYADRYEQARPHCDQAVRTMAEAYGSQHPSYADALTALGNLDGSVGHWAVARAGYQQAAAIYEATNRIDDLSYADVLDHIGGTYTSQDDAAEALVYFERARDLYATYHADHPNRYQALLWLVTAELALGHNVDAIEHAKAALAIEQSHYAPDSIDHLEALLLLGTAYREHQELDRATAVTDEVVERAGRPPLNDVDLLSRGLEQRASLLDDRHQLGPAIAARERALALDNTAGTTTRAANESGLGWELLATGKVADAAPHFERALAFFDTNVGANFERGVARSGLARVTWALGDHARAMVAARLARSELAQARSGHDLAGERAELARWLAERGVR